MNNKYIDKFVRWSRSRFGTTLASINETSLTFEKYKDTKTLFLMAADQGMPKEYSIRAFWIRFLNHDTPFLHGPEKHACLNNLPVIYMNVQRSGEVIIPLNYLYLQQNHLNLKREP